MSTTLYFILFIFLLCSTLVPFGPFNTILVEIRTNPLSSHMFRPGFHMSDSKQRVAFSLSFTLDSFRHIL